ncbi:MAG TPA: retropepsin-like aspartic protease, partial [Allocoleopsis sp.]
MESVIERLLVVSGTVSGFSSSNILIDSGATSNFVSSSFARACNLDMVESDRQIRVRLANGQLVPASRVAHTAAMGVGEYHFGDHVFIVLDELVEYDVVLGRSFLKQSGAVVDHGNDRITFGRAKSLVGGKWRKLAKPKGKYAVFCALVADLVAGRSEIEQDSLLQLLGLRATPGSSQSAGTSAPVDSALHGCVMQVVKQYEDAMRPLEG